MTLWGALIRIRAEKTPIEPDLGHASVGKYKMNCASTFEGLSRFFLVLLRQLI